MKKRSFTFFTSLSKEDLLHLTTEVKETVAFGHTTATKKIFTVAELWDIQRRLKARVQKKYI